MGILLIHGIGSTLERKGQPAPSMLEEFGKQIARHVRSHGERRGYAVQDIDAPEGRLCFRVCDPSRSTDWIISEAAWAKDLLRPDEPTSTTALWGAVLAPWILIRNGASAQGVLRRDESRNVGWALWFEQPRWMRAMFWVGLALALAIFVIIPDGHDGYLDWAWSVLLLISMPLWGGWLAAKYSAVLTAVVLLFVIPIRFALYVMAALALQVMLVLTIVAHLPPGKGRIATRVREMAKSVLNAIERTVGDAYLFLASDDTRHQIIDTVGDRITEASRESQVLIVVAHSQGSAVVDEALQRIEWPSNLVAVHTLGAGFSKLGHLAKVERKKERLLASTAVCWLLLLLAIYFWRRSGIFVGLFVPGLILTIWVFLASSRWSARDTELARGLRLFGEYRQWIDVWASHDLVPDYVPDLGRVDRVMVYNRSSFVWDHTTYVENPVVLDMIARSAADQTGLSPSMPQSEFDALRWQRSARGALWRFSAALAGSATFLVVESMTRSGIWSSLVAFIAMVVTRAVWLRWDREARRLEESEASTVPVEGTSFLNPFKWWHLDSVPLAYLDVPPEILL